MPPWCSVQWPTGRVLVSDRLGKTRLLHSRYSRSSSTCPGLASVVVEATLFARISPAVLWGRCRRAPGDSRHLAHILLQREHCRVGSRLVLFWVQEDRGGRGAQQASCCSWSTLRVKALH